MKPSTLRSAALLGFSLALAACGSHDGTPSQPASPNSPTATGGEMPQLVLSPSQVAGTVTATSDVEATVSPSTGLGMPAGSRGVLPNGFSLSIKSDPRPDSSGVIKGDGSVTVNYDACDSTVGAGKTAFFLFDLNFDNVADVVGKDNACSQEHTYRVRPSPTGGPAQNFAANVCVADGNPGAHDPSTFFACRRFHISVEPLTCALPSISTGLGGLIAPHLINLDLPLANLFTWDGRIVAEGLPPNWSLSQDMVMSLRPSKAGTYHPVIHAKTQCGDAAVSFFVTLT